MFDYYELGIYTICKYGLGSNENEDKGKREGHCFA